MQFSNREDIIAITPEWKGERFEDGRPKVPDKYLDALYGMTLEELWKPIFVAGYEHQFVAMNPLHPEFNVDGSVNRKLVGRALTAAYVPTRPDYYAASCAIASSRLSAIPSSASCTASFVSCTPCIVLISIIFLLSFCSTEPNH